MAKDRFECEIDFSQLSSYGPLAWMVRPCEWYLQEYRDCKCKKVFFKITLECKILQFVAIRARVHQYFITGSYSSCDDWRDDYYSCSKFRKSNDLNALVLSHWNPLKMTNLYLHRTVSLTASCAGRKRDLPTVEPMMCGNTERNRHKTGASPSLISNSAIVSSSLLYFLCGNQNLFILALNSFLI